MRYFIIGFKSSGKTTTGKELASILKMDFIDLDEEIEKMNGRSIPEIFTEDGENEFRKLEWKTLKEIVKKDNVIVSTGGGVPCHCENMALMEKHGEIIYLKVDSHTLVNRLEKVTAERPIVKNKTREELFQFVEELKNKCEHHYLRANYIVDGYNLDIKKLAKMLKG